MILIKRVLLKSSKTQNKTYDYEGEGRLGLVWVGSGWVKMRSVGLRWVALGDLK